MQHKLWILQETNSVQTLSAVGGGKRSRYCLYLQCFCATAASNGPIASPPDFRLINVGKRLCDVKRGTLKCSEVHFE